MSVKVLVLLLAVSRVESLDLPISTDKNYGTFDVKDEKDFCTVTCFDHSKHIGCLCSGGSTANPDCQRYPPGDYVEFREEMVELHNTYRSNVAMGRSPAVKSTEPMYTVDYDLGLEYMATCTSYKCSLQQDYCFPLKKFDKFIQDVYHTRTKKLIEYKKLAGIVVKSWYNDIPFKKPTTEIDLKLKMRWGHWSALAWPNLTHIGCSARFKHNPSADLSHDIFVVCSYGSNVGTKQVAESSSSKKCTQCPDTTVCNRDFTGLCGEVSQIPIADIQIIINGSIVSDSVKKSGKSDGTNVIAIALISAFCLLTTLVAVVVIIWKCVLKR